MTVKKCAERGFVLISALLLLILIAAVTGIFTETAQLQQARQMAQTAADAAAVAACFEMRKGNTSGMRAAAEADAARNGFSSERGASVVVHTPPMSGEFQANTGAVEVELSVEQPLILMKMFGPSTVRIAARAVATAGAAGQVTLGE